MSSLLSPPSSKQASFQNHRFEEIVALFKVMDAFEEKLEKEPSIIAQSSLSVIRDFVNEKETLSKDYNTMLESFVSSGLIQKLNINEKMHIRRRLQRLQENLKKNLHQLQAYTDHTERLAEVRRQSFIKQQKSAFYTRRGCTLAVSKASHLYERI